MRSVWLSVAGMEPTDHLTGMDRLRSQRGLMAKLAATLGISRSAVAMWKEVPAERVVAVEAATGIPRQSLRPDIFADASEHAHARSRGAAA